MFCHHHIAQLGIQRRQWRRRLDSNLLPKVGCSGCASNTYETADAGCTQLGAQIPGAHSPDLARVVARWDTLPEHVRHVILTLVDGV